jgi:fructose-1,6-bisphosphatase/inositol monophosphatase family enzyme
MKYDEFLEFAKDVARAAGEIMLKYFKSTSAEWKPDETPVTLADTEINDLLIRRVREKFPTHSVDGEEARFGATNGGTMVWVCDPVDGTRQFAAEVPLATCSLALVEDGESVVGVVADPFSRDLWWATKGGGAFKNGRRIHVNDVKFGDQKCVLVYEYFTRSFDIWDTMAVLKGKSNTNLMLCSIIRAFMAVADGNYTGAIFPGAEHKNCDVAAASVIIREAGGCVCNFAGGQDRMDGDINGFIASNKIVHAEIVKTLRATVKVVGK